MQVVQVVPAFWRVHLGMCVGSLMLRTCLNAGSGPLVVCSLLLSALSLCLWCVGFEYSPISRFKGVFSAVWGCCVGLLGLRALRGLCGFCARVELGGLKACCVFASVFLLLSSAFLLCLSSGALPLLSLACPFSCFCSLCLLVGFSFSLADYTQKRAQRFCSLRPLFVCCGLV